MNLRINETEEPSGTGLNQGFSHSSSWLASQSLAEGTRRK